MQGHEAIDAAIQRRVSLMQAPYNTAYRLINGFLESLPGIVIEVFGKTLVFHDYTTDANLTPTLQPIVLKHMPWVTCCIIKKRRSKLFKEQAGTIFYGEQEDDRILEGGIWYSIDLLMNQDASFYLDTRGLRAWLGANMVGKRVLNTFAYTGSLGVSALAGGAKSVVQLDLNRQFLSVAKRSAALNGLKYEDKMYQAGDFWSRINHFKTIGSVFDCVILDPPVFSKTDKATIDVTKNYHKLINKVRPLIADGGRLITINNALFQSGEAHQDVLKRICKDGYVTIDAIIPVPFDCIGATVTPQGGLPTDPAPYNHATKITVLQVTKK